MRQAVQNLVELIEDKEQSNFYGQFELFFRGGRLYRVVIQESILLEGEHEATKEPEAPTNGGKA
jgi:hypothetical protein